MNMLKIISYVLYGTEKNMEENLLIFTLMILIA